LTAELDGCSIEFLYLHVVIDHEYCGGNRVENRAVKRHIRCHSNFVYRQPETATCPVGIAPHILHGGGAILPKAADRSYGLIQALAGCLRDKRQAGKVDHSLRELSAQRVLSIACGYPDANDSARLSCHCFRGNEVRLWLSILAYNLGDLWRRLALPAESAENP
jgi:hypothetical protein